MSLVYNQQGAEEKENIEGASCINVSALASLFVFMRPFASPSSDLRN